MEPQLRLRRRRAAQFGEIALELIGAAEEDPQRVPRRPRHAALAQLRRAQRLGQAELLEQGSPTVRLARGEAVERARARKLGQPDGKEGVVRVAGLDEPEQEQ
eukprot:CAMPEP_0119403840 /NCGR_PEP_ID=MMETSP1334-20130426/143589_1 /TAXON_ID=127549 /ORGANISM="Calcidiscus leptoporus, Strain RCC1130" /LENGTH=102 /DNA_ID=CAMNT_0007427791 /DNA_START=794 /DNA_END=1099 /DNA_ORIENTATION=-